MSFQKIDRKEAKRQIDKIFETFDFHKVHDAMTALNWTWARCKGVPSIKTLKIVARRLLYDAARRGTISTGGFRAENNGGYFRLVFEIDDCDLEEIEFGTPIHTIKAIKEICNEMR